MARTGRILLVLPDGSARRLDLISSGLLPASNAAERRSLRVNRSTRYATEFMAAVAQATGDDPVSIAAVAQQRSLPASFLRQIAVGLTRAGLLGAHPGCRGGYVLARAAESITLRDIVEALEGPIEETDDQSETSVSDALWAELGKEWAHTLDRYSLDALRKLFSANKV